MLHLIQSSKIIKLSLYTNTWILFLTIARYT